VTTEQKQMEAADFLGWPWDILKAVDRLLASAKAKELPLALEPAAGGWRASLGPMKTGVYVEPRDAVVGLDVLVRAG